MKKVFLIVLFFSLIPGSVFAIGNPCKPFGENYGLVPPPSGARGEYILTDLFRMVAGIINCIIFGIVPPVAVLFLIIGGVVFLFGGASPEILSMGKRILLTTIIGMLIVYAGWLIINTIICAIAKAEICTNWWHPF